MHIIKLLPGVHIVLVYGSPLVAGRFFGSQFEGLNMLAIADINRFGHLELDVINKRLRHKLIKEFSLNRNESILYIQQDTQVSDFIENYVPKNSRRSLNDGWSVRFRISYDVFSVFLGV